ncbi:uncharacterized protein LOC142550316 [Primulina tabacum]|uniref:uncharacterized protein LOC142550316 n=1 Tax=Primulina tabacum TaxID=48773 RepID=UPI003F59853D
MEEAQKQKRDTLKREKSDRVVRPEERAHKKVNSGNFFHHVPLRIARDMDVQECSMERSSDLHPPQQSARPEKKGLCTHHKIFGGSTDDDSNRAQKARGRRECLEVEGVKRNDLFISFGPDDLRVVSLPHNGALELVGISPLIAEHNLNIIPRSQPVRQKKRHFGPEKDKVIDEKVRELLQAVHIREIQFPIRLSNVVLIPKAAGKWRIVFEKQLGKNVEVYVDDILGKSREISCFISNLEETFATIMHYGIKLAKCIFGVKSSKLLDFVVTDRGIEILRKAQKFCWNDGCEKAFKNLKNHLAELPILVKPEPEEKLYNEVKRIALALVMTARKLRPYFLSHPIIMLTNSPFERIMTHPEVSGRMVKWTVELGKYDMEYKPRAAIKAHALSDYLLEMTQPNEEEVWRVFVGGEANLIGCGVGVVITAPSGEKNKLALRIDSWFTNNDAEYEAILAGIRAAWEVRASRIILYSDLQIVTQQIKGIYEAKNDKMLKYLQLIKTQAKSLVDWSIEQIPRDANVEADSLAKMLASLPDVNTREVLYFARLVLSIDEDVPPPRESSWMTPLIEFITHGKLPEEKAQAQKIKKQALRFVLLNKVLHKRSYQGPLLKCIAMGEVEYILREIHEGCCEEHLRRIALARKTMLDGF